MLVADDLVDNVDTLASLLRIMGHEVRAAADGQEAVATARVFRPEVVLLDIGMPKLNGYEACRRIRADAMGNKMFIVALTAWSEPADRARSRDAGFDLHLAKPLDPTELQALFASLPVRGNSREG